MAAVVCYYVGIKVKFVTMMYVVVGLGNPGEEYEDTRHNTGRLALEVFRKAHDFPDWEDSSRYKALISEGKIGAEKVLLLEPETFMNKSGGALGSLIGDRKKAERLIVVHDDLDLPVGRFKISFNKSAGGHRGVASVIKAIKTEGFIRIRVGISAIGPAKKGGVKKPQGEDAVLKHILGKFKPAETEVLKKTFKKVAEAIEAIVRDGREKAMGEYNQA